MPKIEYQCPQCRHRFEKLVFRGDEPRFARCPECDNAEAERIEGQEPVFKGISSFLAKDTN